MTRDWKTYFYEGLTQHLHRVKRLRARQIDEVVSSKAFEDLMVKVPQELIETPDGRTLVRLSGKMASGSPWVSIMYCVAEGGAFTVSPMDASGDKGGMRWVFARDDPKATASWDGFGRAIIHNHRKMNGPRAKFAYVTGLDWGNTMRGEALVIRDRLHDIGITHPKDRVTRGRMASFIHRFEEERIEGLIDQLFGQLDDEARAYMKGHGLRSGTHYNIFCGHGNPVSAKRRRETAQTSLRGVWNWALQHPPILAAVDNLENQKGVSPMPILATSIGVENPTKAAVTFVGAYGDYLRVQHHAQDYASALRPSLKLLSLVDPSWFKGDFSKDELRNIAAVASLLVEAVRVMGVSEGDVIREFSRNIPSNVSRWEVIQQRMSSRIQAIRHIEDWRRQVVRPLLVAEIGRVTDGKMPLQQTNELATKLEQKLVGGSIADKIAASERFHQDPIAFTTKIRGLSIPRELPKDMLGNVWVPILNSRIVRGGDGSAFLMAAMSTMEDLDKLGARQSHCVAGYRHNCIYNKSHIIAILRVDGLLDKAMIEGIEHEDIDGRPILLNALHTAPADVVQTRLSTLHLTEKQPPYGTAVKEVGLAGELLANTEHKGYKNRAASGHERAAVNKLLADYEVDMTTSWERKNAYRKGYQEPQKWQSQVGFVPWEAPDKMDELFGICKGFLPTKSQRHCDTFQEWAREIGLIRALENELAPALEQGER